MFVAVHEIRRLLGRFVLLTGAIALLVVLLLFFQTVAGALTTGLTGGMQHNQADVIVYSDKARNNPAASFMTTNAVDAVAKIDGVAHAAGVAHASFTATDTKTDVTVIGQQDLNFGGPVELADGRRPTKSGEALASTPGLSAADVTYSTGDTLTIEGVKLTVVGTAANAAFDVSPTMYVTFDDYQAMNQHYAGSPVPPLLSWVAVQVDEGAKPDDVAKRISEQATFDPAEAEMPAGLDGPPGAGPPGGGPPGVGAPTTAPASSTPATNSTAPASTDSSADSSNDTATGAATTDGAQPADSSAPAATTATSPPAPATSTPGATTTATASPATTSPATTSPSTTSPGATAPPGAPDSGGPPSGVTGGPPPGAADALAGMSGGLTGLTRAAATADLPGVGQITQSFNILYLLLFIVVTIVTGVFFLILTVQKQNSLVLMRALGASKADAVKPVLIEVVMVVGFGSVLGAAVAAGLLYLARSSFGSSLSPVTTVLSVLFILVLGVLASFGSVRRVLAIDPVQAARRGGH